MGEGLDIISLRGLSAVGQHGVYDFERSGSQVFTADLTLHVDATKAAETDEVEYTVDYSVIADSAVAILTGTPVYLLETLANRLAQMALENPLVQKVEATVHKPMAPVAHLFNDVSVTLVRTRESVPHAQESAKPAVASPAAPPQLANLLIESPAPTSRPGAARLVLALGSNQGDSRTLLSQAISALIEAPGIEIDEVSPLVVTKPVLAVGQGDQADYFNAVVLARTVLSPEEVLEVTQSIETQYGRVRDQNWGPRTLDIDLIDYSGKSISLPNLQLPHPRAAHRAFVLYPWSLIEPEGEFAGEPLVDLAQKAPDRSGILRVQRDWLQEDEDATTSQAEGTPPSVPAEPAVAAAAPAAASYATIRGNRIRLEEKTGDGIFQALLQEELAKTAPAPRAVRTADQKQTKPVAAPVLPKRSRVAPTAAVPAAEKPPAPRKVPFPHGSRVQRTLERSSEPVGEPSLPSWRFGQQHGDVRIVDSVDSAATTEGERRRPEPMQDSADVPSSRARHVRRKVVRPTPTGMIAVTKGRGGDKKLES